MNSRFRELLFIPGASLKVSVSFTALLLSNMKPMLKSRNILILKSNDVPQKSPQMRTELFIIDKETPSSIWTLFVAKMGKRLGI